MIIGIFEGTMNRDEGYRFMGIARALERADMTSRIIDVRTLQLADEHDLRIMKTLQWSNVLRSISGYQMYRRKVQNRVRGTDVVKFILLDESFPRAIYRCASRIIDHLSHIQNNSECVSQANTLLEQLSQSEKHFESAWQDWFHLYIDEIQKQLAEIHNSITNKYF